MRVGRSGWRTDGRKRFCSQLNNSKNGKKWTICVNTELIGSHRLTIEWIISDPRFPSNTRNRWLIDHLSNFSQPVGGWLKFKLSTINDTLAGCEMMQWIILTAFVQACERRLSTICAVVERPHHQCGDDLVCCCLGERQRLDQYYVSYLDRQII